MRRAIVVAVLLLAIVAGAAVAQDGGPVLLETGCTGGTAWALVQGEGGAVGFDWYEGDHETGGALITGGALDFDQWEIWRVGFAGMGRALRFEAGDLRAYFDEECTPLAGPAPVSPLPLPFRQAETQRLYLPQVVTP